MKKFVSVVYFLLIVFITNGQNLNVEGVAPNLYITHTVAPKENFYSVGRLYNQAPKAIASFNNVSMEKGLAIGQHIKIPLNAQNLDAAASTRTGQGASLTRVVAKGETLSKVAGELNVPVQSLKQWNNLSSDNIAAGTPIVVGYLKLTAPVAANAASSALNAPVAESKVPSKPVAAPVETKKESITSSPINVSTDNREVASSDKGNNSNSSVTETKESSAVSPSPATAPPASQNKENAVKVSQPARNETYSYASTSTTSTEGVFANVFTAEASAKTLNTKSGEAATFKSTSGWQDKKYYVLINDVTPGTIIKIQSAEDKVVYAKVLGSMPDMKENNGLMIRMSNAAASYLGIIDPKFPVQISYYQ